MEHLPAGNALWNAAQAVNVDNPTDEDVIVFVSNMIARKRDRLPDENKEQLMLLIFNAGANIGQFHFDQRTLQFLNEQIGRMGVETLISKVEGDWIVEDCSCGAEPGYHLFTPEQAKMKLDAKKADNLIRAIFGDGSLPDGIVAIGIERAPRGRRH